MKKRKQKIIKRPKKSHLTYTKQMLVLFTTQTLESWLASQEKEISNGHAGLAQYMCCGATRACHHYKRGIDVP